MKNRYLKLSFLYGALTLVLGFFILRYGVVVALKISEFFQERNGKEIPRDIYENVLSSPQFYPLPEATNSASLLISGFSQPNQKVDIYLNDLNIKTLEVDSEGKFQDYISLALGINHIVAATKDTRGVQSPFSKSWEVFYSNSPPYLEIIEPANQTVIKGKNSQIILKGKAAPTSKVSINDHFAIVDREGYFNYSTTLNQGENEFEIVCLDPAQNKSKLKWTLYYQP